MVIISFDWNSRNETTSKIIEDVKPKLINKATKYDKYKVYNIEYQRQNYNRHKQYYNEYSKQYWIEHKHAMIENIKKYYRKNVEGLKEYARMYYQKRKEYILNYHKSFREKRKEEGTNRINCPCGSIVNAWGLCHHRKTKKHIKWLEENVLKK